MPSNTPIPTATTGGVIPASTQNDMAVLNTAIGLYGFGGSPIYGTNPATANAPNFLVQTVNGNITTDSGGNYLVTLPVSFPNCILAAFVSNLVKSAWGPGDATWSVDPDAGVNLGQLTIHAVKGSTGAAYATQNIGFSLVVIGS